VNFIAHWFDVLIFSKFNLNLFKLTAIRNVHALLNL